MASMNSIFRRGARGLARRVRPQPKGDREIAAYAREWILPRPPERHDHFAPSYVLGHRGFDLHVDEQLRRLDTWRDERYQALFRQLRADPAINTGLNGQSAGDGQLHNGYYPTPDAEIYAATILDAKPKEIVEVGSGFSTLVARTAIRYGNLPTKLTVIDPSPRTDVKSAADEIINAYVEDSPLEGRAWSADSLLFIDSSHVCRSRGDLPYLFCKVLPALPEGLTVHVHDIFLPYEYPTNYDKYCYTEQYLLHCLLGNSARYRTMFSTHYLSRDHGEPMRQVFSPKVGVDPIYNGASYWLKIVSPAVSGLH